MKYISLVNLIAGKEVVQELVAKRMTVLELHGELSRLLNDKTYRQQMLDDYAEMAQKLGTPGAPRQAAAIIIQKLS